MLEAGSGESRPLVNYLRVEPKFSDVCPRKRWKKEKHRDPGMKVTWTEAETAEMQPQAQEC